MITIRDAAKALLNSIETPRGRVSVSIYQKNGQEKIIVTVDKRYQYLIPTIPSSIAGYSVDISPKEEIYMN